MMDDAGIDACVLMGWSMGVNTMFEVAVLHPERVTGLLAVGGVPGDTFASMLAPLRVPRPLVKPFTVGVARFLKATGRAISPVASRLPVGPLTLEVITHSGFMLPVPGEALARRAIKEFLTTPTDWYMHLALHSSRHPRVSLRAIDVPVAFVAGQVRRARLRPPHAYGGPADPRGDVPPAARLALPADGEADRGPRGAPGPARPRRRLSRATRGRLGALATLD